jgi:hypothetical protein
MRTTKIAHGGGGKRMRRQHAMLTGSGDRDRDEDNEVDDDCAWRWWREDAMSVRDVDRRRVQGQGWGQR